MKIAINGFARIKNKQAFIDGGIFRKGKALGWINDLDNPKQHTY